MVMITHPMMLGSVANQGAPMAQFIFSVKTDNAGTSASDEFSFPTAASGVCDFNVDWGDATNDDITNYNDTALTHTYAGGAGTYTITVTGVLQTWKFNNGLDKLKLLEISSVGGLEIDDSSMFNGCSNMTWVASVADVPVVTTTTLNSFFKTCSSFNGELAWDTSLVTDMANMFNGCSSFNQELPFDTGEVTTMLAMLANCTIFNKVLTFDTSKVSALSFMLKGSTAWNQDISAWDITAVTVAIDLLSGTAFDQTNYDLLLVAWEGKTHNNTVTAHFGSAVYGAGAPATARGVLTGTDSWTIIDGGPA